MPTALIIYGSSTGNTRKASEIVGGVFSEQGFAVELKDVVDADVAMLEGAYDIALLGCSTWGAVEEEVQEDFLPFYEALDEVDLSGRRMAVFGSGDSGYSVFCKAVDAVEEKARERGARLVVESLKVDGLPKWAEEDIRKWAERAASKAAASG